MNVPFISSGAMNRAHYNLVHRVETAGSTQAADQILLGEINVIRSTLQQQRLSIKACKESLILLLYCTMTLAATTPGDLSFAFPHALNLAELGQSVLDKRIGRRPPCCWRKPFDCCIGYTFCVELMPAKHELQLMLVNTLRKDLESTSIGRICLAMDVLMQMPNEDVAPAVQPRLQFLLHDKNELVRRRAYMTYYVLFHQDCDHIQLLEETLLQASQSTPDIVAPALMMAGKLRSKSLTRLLDSRLQYTWSKYHDPAILHALRKGTMSLDPANIPIIFDVIKHSSEPPRKALLDAFSLLATVSAETISESQAKLSYSPVAGIRHLLTSKDPNEQYIFLSCLGCLHNSTWAGNAPGSASVFDEWEVQGIMKFLDSRDRLIRKMTLNVLFSVDPGIIATYYSRLVENLPSRLPVTEKAEYVSGFLDVIEIQCQENSEQYAMCLKKLFLTVEGEQLGKMEASPVLESCVQRILTHAQNMNTTSRASLVTALVVSATETGCHIGPTLMVIICALVCEDCCKIPTSPLEILRGIARRLCMHTSPVQDVCLLSMLRLSAECDEVPEEVSKVVKGLSQSAGKYIRRRCEQFLTLSQQRHVLADIISRARSPSPLSHGVTSGELKVLLHGSPDSKLAALRLRDGDEESCLWRLRCDDLELRTIIKRLLQGT
ncbi:hypothetical protein ID866_530 [Astraeus odoratus]|nr:hypothetical protein ID866_530 [Astraeus odoratus]